jgi:hypothetical protein
MKCKWIRVGLQQSFRIASGDSECKSKACQAALCSNLLYQRNNICMAVMSAALSMAAAVAMPLTAADPPESVINEVGPDQLLHQNIFVTLLQG